MSNPAVVVAFLLCALVLLVSGIAKLAARQETADAFTALRVPAPSWAPAALPWVEIALGAALLLAPSQLALLPAAATLVLMAAYWVVIGRALTFDEPVTCSCFGRLGAHDVSRLTLARNTLLLLAAGAALVGAWRGYSVPFWVAHHSRADLGWLAATALAAATCTLSLAPERSRRSGRHRAGAAADPDAAAVQGTPEEDYLRAPIPFAVLYVHTGNAVTLRDLARQQAVLLVALSPGCGPCSRIAPQLRQWQDELGPVVSVRALFQTSAAGGEAIAAQHRVVQDLAPEAAPLALYDQQGQTCGLLEMYGSPSAVLLGADGRLAGGPVTGESSILRLVEEMMDELREAQVIGEQAAPPAPAGG